MNHKSRYRIEIIEHQVNGTTLYGFLIFGLWGPVPILFKKHNHTEENKEMWILTVESAMRRATQAIRRIEMECGPIRSNTLPHEGIGPVFECAIDDWNQEKLRWSNGDPDLVTDDLGKAQDWLAADVEPSLVAELEPGRYRKVIREVGRDADGERIYDIEDKRVFSVAKTEIRE